jgi:hypothetical protein
LSKKKATESFNIVPGTMGGWISQRGNQVYLQRAVGAPKIW